ncbi:hypothetical protein FPQ18DRAFT_51739 [Pyronema domesticum]|uniref:Uncharacterized protein n=1 Tax=Pyronema omphalodes (strain CBS 100304) TaxID=1076935 RepID=U4LF06_PYROM|nr:hypothetical protein FPQ18DRAFT_51739 [Pyronema domesticum]CCX10027.1 Similar to hypothetical protein [Tuber melanosporum Mel28]; acc. no. XP_002839632 [Pyronema omphalodes CBS 100304]
MAAIVTPHNPTSGHYTQYHLVQAPTHQQQLVELQRPGQQQVIIQQAPSYQQHQMIHQQPTIVQTRIVHEEIQPTRQFVNFKNLRRLNTSQQWEHCEHITIAISPDELERKVRSHDTPGNDLVHIFTNMGIYRQRHVRKYEERLNNKETDPHNWRWVLEALGELRDKPKSTPHTFWAIFQRTPKKHQVQQPRQVRVHQPIIHHEPVQIVQAPPMQQISAAPAPALPAPQQVLQIQAAPGQQHQGPQYVHIQPASSTGGSSHAGYQHYSAAQYQQTVQQPQVHHGHQQQQPAYTPQYQAQQPQVHQQQRPAVHQAQRPAVHQQLPPQQTQQIQQRPALVQAPPVRQIAAPAPTTTAATAANAAKPRYTRPIPGPLNPVTGRANSPPPISYTRTSDIDLNQFRNREHSPMRGGGFPSPPHRERERREYFDDGASDDSASSYGSSAGTSITDYSTKRHPASAPLGSSHTHRVHQAPPTRQCSSREDIRHQQGPHASAPNLAQAPPNRNYTAEVRTSAPRKVHRNTYDIEVKFGPAPTAPQPPRPSHPARANSYTDSIPRSHLREEDYDSSDAEEYRKPGGLQRRGTTRYEAAGLVSYGSEHRSERRSEKTTRTKRW